MTREGTILGKPASATHALGSLTRLAGARHTVISGVAIRAGGAARLASATTAVTFRELTASQIARYVATGEWQGRAGGYAIQGRGAALVQAIEGDYANVVGLPVALLLDLVPELL